MVCMHKHTQLKIIQSLILSVRVSHERTAHSKRKTNHRIQKKHFTKAFKNPIPLTCDSPKQHNPRCSATPPTPPPHTALQHTHRHRHTHNVETLQLSGCYSCFWCPIGLKPWGNDVCTGLMFACDSLHLIHKPKHGCLSELCLLMWSCFIQQPLNPHIFE